MSETAAVPAAPAAAAEGETGKGRGRKGGPKIVVLPKESVDFGKTLVDAFALADMKADAKHDEARDRYLLRIAGQTIRFEVRQAKKGKQVHFWAGDETYSYPQTSDGGFNLRNIVGVIVNDMVPKLKQRGAARVALEELEGLYGSVKSQDVNLPKGSQLTADNSPKTVHLSLVGSMLAISVQGLTSEQVKGIVAFLESQGGVTLAKTAGTAAA